MIERFDLRELSSSTGRRRLRRAVPVALVSGDPDNAKKVAEQLGIQAKNIYNYQNFDTIRNNPEIDVVYIVLPNSMHEEYTVRAAAARIACWTSSAPDPLRR